MPADSEVECTASASANPGRASIAAARAGSPVSAPVSVGATSAPFEVALQLPVRDAQVVEDDLLLHGGVQQVPEDEVAEDLARDARSAELLDRLVQARGHARHVLGFVGVADEHVRGLDLVADAPHPG